MAKPTRLAAGKAGACARCGTTAAVCRAASMAMRFPLGARLFAVIDTLDAMTSDRSYRKALPFDTAKLEIVRLAGSQFAPEAVDAFLAKEAALREMVAMKCRLEALT